MPCAIGEEPLSLLLLAVAFVVGASFGALIAFILAARSYDKGYADGLTASQAPPPAQSLSPETANFSSPVDS